MASASVALGYRYDWLSQAVRRAGKTLKRLEDKGFTGRQFVEVSIGRATKSGASTAKTISIDDFDKLLEWAEENGTKKAKIIARTYTRATRKRSTIDDIREAFGEERLSLDERRKLFYQELAWAFSESDWREGDRAVDFKLVAELKSEGWEPPILFTLLDR
ncbi:hypothetical protein [Okeania sp. SIO2B3]|uniref:hypothetical protein n=1 Tax=Okeania sp. SIO2B3 TaxID=2607784 RepID=UPI0013C10031|nr:hypothetical protein [Okeania sp. SIO2B3]NET46643.1 hypothetical protein [Okeania sp. SIO2B3]